MISVDTLEVLIRSIHQYFLFGALAFFLFGWMNKKPLYSMIAEIILVFTGIVILIVLLSGMIPSPETEGLNADHIKQVTKMLILFCGMGFLSIISLSIRIIRKKPFNPLIIVIFLLAVVVFFQSTRISRIKFEFNKPQTTITDTIN